jgi:Domain of unknown function (DUF4326)
VTAVIDLHGRRDDPQYDPALNPNVIYIGCSQWWGRDRKLEGHPLGNPWARYMKRLGRDEVVRRYREHLLSHPDLIQIAVDLVHSGKTMGCWCAPEPCHADVILEIVALVDAGLIQLPELGR